MPDYPLVLAEMSTWLYVSACIVVPLAWGLGTEFVFRWLESRKRARQDGPHTGEQD